MARFPLPARRFFRVTLRALAWLTFALVTSDASAASRALVTDARVGLHQDVTRVVFDLTSPIDYEVFTLPDPQRVVIDLSEATWRVPEHALPSAKGVVGNIRHGQFNPRTMRVVLECNGPLTVEQVRMLKASGNRGHSLVIDILSAAGRRAGGIARDVSRPPAAALGRAGPSLKPSQPRPAGRFAPVVFAPLPRRPSAVPALRTVVLDPGHGGNDPGATGLSGIYEKHITLKVAREVRDRLMERGGYKVILTRDRDVILRLRDRFAVARSAGADLFVSIHADAMRNSSVRGASVYTLSETSSDKEAAMLAEQENKADLIAGVDLTDESEEVTSILIDIAQRETMNRSAQLAAMLVNELHRETRLLPNAHRFAGFAVLKAPDVPSVLVELGFLSNRDDERMLHENAHRRKLAGSIAQAIERFFDGVEEARRN